jgi:hypothetical protein
MSSSQKVQQRGIITSQGGQQGSPLLFSGHWPLCPELVFWSHSITTTCHISQHSLTVPSNVVNQSVMHCSRYPIDLLLFAYEV